MIALPQDPNGNPREIAGDDSPAVSSADMRIAMPSIATANPNVPAKLSATSARTSFVTDAEAIIAFLSGNSLKTIEDHRI